MYRPLLTPRLARRDFLRACVSVAAGFGYVDILLRQARVTQTTSNYPGTPRSLNPRWTFESFVPGAGNCSAHIACLAASEARRVCDPLLIYGAVGLGKSHLLHAVGHQICGRYPGERVLYTTAEQFADQFIGGNANAWLKSERAEVLLIDDIQFLPSNQSAKPGFLDFFHAFFESQKQLIFTSDRPPEEIAQFQPWLKQRIHRPSTVELSPPDIETAKSILRKKSDSIDFEPDERLFAYLAQHFRGNVRRMEGALMRVASYPLSHDGKVPDYHEICRMLRDLFLMQGAA